MAGSSLHSPDRFAFVRLQGRHAFAPAGGEHSSPNSKTKIILLNESGRARVSSIVATLALFVLMISGFALVRASVGERFPWPESLSRIFGARTAKTLTPAIPAVGATFMSSGSGSWN